MHRMFVAVLFVPLFALAQGAQLVDRIVAVVNKEVITLSELGVAVASAERQLRRQGTALPDRAVLERQILERLILDKAQLQRARDTGIRIDELQLDRAVQRIADNNKMTLADFRRALERDRVAFDAWREELRDRSRLRRSASRRRARGRRRRLPKRAPGAISPTSSPPIPTRRTRCRAATSGGARTSGCRSFLPPRSRA